MWEVSYYMGVAGGGWQNLMGEAGLGWIVLGNLVYSIGHVWNPSWMLAIQPDIQFCMYLLPSLPYLSTSQKLLRSMLSLGQTAIGWLQRWPRGHCNWIVWVDLTILLLWQWNSLLIRLKIGNSFIEMFVLGYRRTLERLTDWGVLRGLSFGSSWPNSLCGHKLNI